MCQAVAEEQDEQASELSTESDEDGSGCAADDGEGECWGILPAPCENCLIFDWDDTLLPLSWLQLQQGTRNGEGAGALPQDKAEQLRDAERVVVETLRAAKLLGTVIVVTNGDQGWVQLSAERYLPSCLPLLEGVEVLSARSAYEGCAPGRPGEWKRLAFEHVIGNFCQTLSAGRWANIVSIGDQLWERDALFAATEDVPGCWSKSVKLLDRPSLRQFIHEHKMIQEGLESVVTRRGNLDLALQKSDSGI